MRRRDPFLWLALAAFASAATTACTSSRCPAGTTQLGDRCLVEDAGLADSGANDAGRDAPPVDGGPCVPRTYYSDLDRDGYGDDDFGFVTCELLIGLATRDGDCDDARTEANPEASELCNGLDDDCDGDADEAFDCVRGEALSCASSCGTTGRGLCSATCALPTGAACTPPVESCNTLDEDCDGVPDEGTTRVVRGAEIPGIHVGLVTAVATANVAMVFYLAPDSSIKARRFDRRGVTLGGVIDVAPSTSANVFVASASADAAYFLYSVTGTPRRLLMRRVTEGGVVGAEIVVSADATLVSDANLAATPDGAMIFLRTDGAFTSRRYTLSGLSPEATVLTDSNARGGFLVASVAGAPYAFYMARTAYAGAGVDNPDVELVGVSAAGIGTRLGFISASASEQEYVSGLAVDPESGTIAVAYAVSDGEVRARLFDATTATMSAPSAVIGDISREAGLGDPLAMVELVYSRGRFIAALGQQHPATFTFENPGILVVLDRALSIVDGGAGAAIYLECAGMPCAPLHGDFAGSMVVPGDGDPFIVNYDGRTYRLGCP